ncbi:MAG: hypothetical protein AMK71_05955 [Nitrospira bacterium SG8_35_4]|nr:MAG: hypothetical protein AMK71_05955 [Nitrospira bacterium SG8_35_4]
MCLQSLKPQDVSGYYKDAVDLSRIREGKQRVNILPYEAGDIMKTGDSLTYPGKGTLSNGCLCAIFIILFMTSCATQVKKTVTEQRVTPPAGQTVKKAVAEKEMTCSEHTSRVFNFSGIGVMPYLKLAFYDMDGDGLTDMIMGGKHGRVSLFRNLGYPSVQEWQRVDGFFDGVHAGAFSAPAVGDINGDGKPEIAIGTGGFSSKSGRILVFENKGTVTRPEWTELTDLKMDVGDDAAPAIVDYNFDGNPDIIAGNSEGKLFFYRNVSDNRRMTFQRDTSRSVTKSLDKYAVPAAVKVKDKVILVVGTSMGKLYRFDLMKHSSVLRAKKLDMPSVSKRFLSPAFITLTDESSDDLVIADGDGSIFYYHNVKNNFSAWEKDHELFNNRLIAGPACAPTIADIDGKVCIVVGNIDGTFKFYEQVSTDNGLPWLEEPGVLQSLKVSGFSRGILTQWQDRELLITGESNGDIRAFRNTGTRSKPSWKEQSGFFRGIKTAYHSTPAAFDLDNDGNWELITGAEDGGLSAYRIGNTGDGNPTWEFIPGIFDNIRMRGFSSPAFVRYNGSIYLFAGQEDGRIRTFRADASMSRNASQGNARFPRFSETDFLKKLKMNNHSSPSVRIHDGSIELISGDYDGNIRHFVCNE